MHTAFDPLTNGYLEESILALAGMAQWIEHGPVTVSYTHLTLPTIRA